MIRSGLKTLTLNQNVSALSLGQSAFFERTLCNAAEIDFPRAFLVEAFLGISKE